MRKHKKIWIISALCLIVLAGTLGGFAIASADDNNNTAPPKAAELRTELYQKVAEIYEQNTGTAIDSSELQKAFDQALQAKMDEAQDQFLQKLIDDGKITQEQADSWKTWLDSRPKDVLSDEFKTWLQQRPDIPALCPGNQDGRMPFGGERGFKGPGRGMMPNFRGGFPGSDT